LAVDRPPCGLGIKKRKKKGHSSVELKGGKGGGVYMGWESAGEKMAKLNEKKGEW